MENQVKEEGRRKKEEGRRRKEEGGRRKEEERMKDLLLHPSSVHTSSVRRMERQL
jgi:hypothetical protein